MAVFLEGDGSPWIGGRKVASDPTARDPLALRLAIRTPGEVAYVVRPCYQQRSRDPLCSADLWTSARYGDAVVNSMAASINLVAGSRAVVLVGYSGGGALAALLARRLPTVAALVTIASNLDTEAWARMHGYLPLTGSINPMTEDPLPARIAQIHLYGGRDSNIPADTAQRFASRQGSASAIAFPDFDHSCCWVSAWPEIWAQLDIGVAVSR